MRPVNLIPPEDRRGEGAGLRTGALPYVVLGALGVAVLALAVLVLTGKQVSEREAELSRVEAQEQSMRAQAEALRPYADFAALSAAREQTVTSLAQSRFDWERVLRELALVMPEDIWLVEARGTVAPDVEVQGGTGVDGRDEIAGPALELIGCGATHESVAVFVAALRDIDGVTRVGVTSSARPDPDVGGTAAPPTGDSAGQGTTTECRTRDHIAKFEILAAFDAVTVPSVGSVPEEAAPAAPGDPAAPPADGSAPTPEGAPADGSAPTGGQAAAPAGGRSGSKQSSKVSSGGAG